MLKSAEKHWASVHWTGRMQQVAPDVWVDGAHNPGGIRAFIQAVKAQNGLAVQEKQSAQQPDQGEQNAADHASTDPAPLRCSFG